MANNFVHVFEVGPRDGLQNEPELVSISNKAKFIQDLISAGIKDIEVGAFVRPDKVPQMADTERLFLHPKLKNAAARRWALVPNLKGMERAIRVGAHRIALFTAATEGFSKKNIGMSIRESLHEFQRIVELGKQAFGSRLEVRGYVSTAFGCPFEGKVAPSKALRVIAQLQKLGVDQVSIGDTIGVATPNQVNSIIQPALKMLGSGRVAVHLHDTRGTALANTLRALELGVRIVDSSAGGLGGCPFAPGASGNLATEDLVYMLHGMGMKTGIDLDKLCKASRTLSKKTRLHLASRFLMA